MVDWWATHDGEAYNGKTGDENNAVVSEYRPMFVGFTVNADDNNNVIAAPYDPTLPFWGNMCLNKTHQIIRYSEVLCWFAEASARSGKYAGEALQALQQVQARAYATGVTPDNSDLAEAAVREHGYEVAGNGYSLVTRRADEFRLNILKEAYDYRRLPLANTRVLVPAGTLTHSVKKDGTPFTYTLKEDLKLEENMPVTAAWQGENSIYQIYPTTESEKNPNLKR